MKVVTDIVQKEVEINTYIAEDGTPFDDEEMCTQYETDARIDELNRLTSELLIHRDNFIPCDGGHYSDNHETYWYQVNSNEDVEKLNELYDAQIHIYRFPEYINIIFEDGEVQSWGMLSNCVDYVKKFFGNGFGIDVDFKKREDK